MPAPIAVSRREAKDVAHERAPHRRLGRRSSRRTSSWALGLLDVGGTRGWIPLWLLPFVALAFLAPATVGLLIAIRQPRNTIAWILLLGAFALDLAAAARLLVLRGLVAPDGQGAVAAALRLADRRHLTSSRTGACCRAAGAGSPVPGPRASSASSRSHCSTRSRSTATTPRCRTRWRTTRWRAGIEDRASADLGPCLARDPGSLFAGASRSASPAQVDRNRAAADDVAGLGGGADPLGLFDVRALRVRARRLVPRLDLFPFLLLMQAASRRRSASRSPATGCSRSSGSSTARSSTRRSRSCCSARTSGSPSARRPRRRRLRMGRRRRRRSPSPSPSGRCARGFRTSSTGATAAPGTRACVWCGRSRTRCATAGGRRRRSARCSPRRSATRSPSSLLAPRDRGVCRCLGRDRRRAAERRTGQHRDPSRRRAHRRASPRPAAARAARPARRRPRRCRALDRDGAAPRRGTPAACGGGGVEDANRGGRLRGAPAARARPARRRPAAARLARRAAQAPTAHVAARRADPLPGARSDRRRGGRGDRRPPPDRGRRAAGATRRRPLRRPAGSRTFVAGAGRRRGARRARRRERRGGRVLRRLRGAHERRQVRLPSKVAVRAVRENGTLHVSISDDGVGGAVVRRGSGLAGLRGPRGGARRNVRDREPAGGGTRVEVAIPCES